MPNTIKDPYGDWAEVYIQEVERGVNVAKPVAKGDSYATKQYQREARTAVPVPLLRYVTASSAVTLDRVSAVAVDSKDRQ